MRKTLLLIALSFILLNNTLTADVIVENFDSKNIGFTYPLKAWYSTDGTATVVADPVNSSNKAVNIVTTNWDAMLKLTVTLPAGKKLSDYTGISFDIYFGTNANDANPNYKNMNIYLDDVKKHEDTGYPSQANMATWTTKTYLLSSLNLTTEEGAKTTFTIAFGISTDKGNYLIDNVILTGGGVVPPPPTGNVTLDFSQSTIGQIETMKAWNATDGSATIAADPTNAGNKVVNIVTSNWDAMLKLIITLPAGKSLTNYGSFSFDIYIGPIANDANPNYKNMFIYLDDVKKYEDTTYPKQADMSTWTTKTFVFAALGLTPVELAKTTITLAFGMSTDKGNYYIDNVKLTEKTSGLKQTNKLNHNIFIAGNMLYLDNKQAEKILIYDIKGSLLIADHNKSVVDVSTLPSGIFVAKVQIDGDIFTNKIVK
ncbi:MAG TPA: T9SS type A sorting domain-containing protein [Paludibacter sp.]|nr:T9SS type A sorting domain-containing protein [Paludibacter sp.]